MTSLSPLRALRALRALVRVEWRQISRHPRRSALVLMLVAVPVAAIVGGSALGRLTQPSPQDFARQRLGQANLRVDGFASWQDLEKIHAALPPETTKHIGIEGLERVSVPGLRLRARLLAVEPAALEAEASQAEALVDGMVRLRAGRAPRNAGEVALSPSLLKGLDRSLGESVTLEYGGARTIVGLVVDPEDLTQPLVVRVPAQAEYPGRRFLLTSLAPSKIAETAATVRALELESPISVQTRAEATVGDEAITAFIFALGIIGLFEAGLVISAAFGVSFRRRQAELGLLGSVGAPAKRLTHSLLLGAAVLATLGGLLGSVLGLVAVRVLHPWLEGWTARMVPDLTLEPAPILGAIILGVIAAVTAAALPARAAARLPIREALAGRRPSSRRSRPWLIAGLGMIAIGFVLLFFATQENKFLRATGVILGPIVGILGFGACSPWLLEWSTQRVSGLPLAWRLAVRDAGRFRERNAAVVTAVLASMAMSVTMASLIASLEDAFEAFPAIFRPDQMLVEGPGAQAAVDAIQRELPVLAAAPLAAAYLHGEPLRGEIDGKEIRRRSAWVAIGDEDLLLALGGGAGTAAFKSGKVVALDLPDGQLEFSTWASKDPASLATIERVTTEKTVREPVFVLRHGSSTTVTEGTGSRSAGARSQTLEAGPPPRGSLIPWIVRLDRPLTPELLAQARGFASRSVGTSVDATLLHSNRFRSVYYVILLICALTGLIVVLTAVSLSAAESAADERVLETVGAAPRVLREHQAARAGFLALLGCLLALPAGLLAAAAFSGAVNFPLDFAMPWRDLLIIGLGLPAIVYASTWFFSGQFSGDRLSRPKLISEATT